MRYLGALSHHSHAFHGVLGDERSVNGSVRRRHHVIHRALTGGPACRRHVRGGTLPIELLLCIWHVPCLHIVVASIKSVRAVHSSATLARGGHCKSSVLRGHEILVVGSEIRHSKHLLRLPRPVTAALHSGGDIPTRLRVLIITRKTAFLGTRDGPLLVPCLRQLLFTILELDLFLFDLALGLVVDLG